MALKNDELRMRNETADLKLSHTDYVLSDSRMALNSKGAAQYSIEDRSMYF